MVVSDRSRRDWTWLGGYARHSNHPASMRCLCHGILHVLKRTPSLLLLTASSRAPEGEYSATTALPPSAPTREKKLAWNIGRCSLYLIPTSCRAINNENTRPPRDAPSVCLQRTSYQLIPVRCLRHYERSQASLHDAIMGWKSLET